MTDREHERATSVAAKRKSAELSSGLVAAKGTTAQGADVALPLRETQEDAPALAPLNFRVSAAFRREFKTFAAQHDLKLNELLRRSFEAYRQKER